MKICIIGTGHVGLVTGVCFADLGNQVICVDNNKDKINKLKKGLMPIFEPALEDMVLRNARLKRLTFSADIKSAVKKSEVIFIAVGTPSKPNGEADLCDIENVARQVASSLDSSYRLVVEKSTVPVETGEWVRHTVKINAKKKTNFDVASNPEFLKEGSAINDFMRPDRIVLGVDSKRAKEVLLGLYKPLKAPIIVTDIKSAELIKHASNSFLATKISFINAIANICDRTGADIVKVAEGMGLDKRIGRQFLNAGAGWGGSCFPKDIASFIYIADKLGYDFGLLKEVARINHQQKKVLLEKIRQGLWILKGKTVAVLGLAFKTDTDDIRSSVSIDLIKLLQEEGVKIRAYDPNAMQKTRDWRASEPARQSAGIMFCKDAYDAAKGSDCVVVMTEWPEFLELDFTRIKRLMRQPFLVDGRNMYEPAMLKRIGFRYAGIGRR